MVSSTVRLHMNVPEDSLCLLKYGCQPHYSRMMKVNVCERSVKEQLLIVTVVWCQNQGCMYTDFMRNSLNAIWDRTPSGLFEKEELLFHVCSEGI